MNNNNSIQLRNEIDSMPIGKFMTQECIKNRAIKLMGYDDALKFITAITSAVEANSKLQECTNTSIFNAAMLGQSLKLSPSPELGQCYMVPYKVKDQLTKKYKMVAQFQLGYKGYIQLAIRTGEYKKINVAEVKEGEFRSYDPFNEAIVLTPITNYNERKNKPVIGYYAMFELQNGFTKNLYMSKEEMMDHADEYSPAFSKEIYTKIQNNEIPEEEMWKYSSHWYKNFDEMGKKTMLRKIISKWGYMSIEMQRAYKNDMAEITDDGKPNYIDSYNVKEVKPVEEPTEEAKPVEAKPVEEKLVEEKVIPKVDINEL